MTEQSHVVTYPRFILRAIWRATDGRPAFYVWMTALSAIALVGARAWAGQVVHGMALTGMSDHVSWGLYIANFTFGVGLAAGAVMMVIPAYLYDDHEMHDVTLVGEILAVAAIVVSLLFVVVDLGRPDRFWHLLPFVGRFNWPVSMLTWDVVVLNGYLLLNLHICGYLIYMRYLRRTPDPRWYLPFVFLSILWAVSIHSVTAFLYSGLGGRPFWNSALLAPRFIVTAFVTGPAFVIGLLHALRWVAGLAIGDGPIATLVSVMRVTIPVNLFMLGSELFTHLYAGGSHSASVRYLFFGLHGRTGLVAWTWCSLALNVASLALIYLPRLLHARTSRALSGGAAGRLSLARYRWMVLAACAAAFAGVWIEKGMGLIVPGFVPSTLHEIVEYSPSLVEWKITAGIWAFGFLVLTAGLKVALPVLTGALAHEQPAPPAAGQAAT